MKKQNKKKIFIGAGLLGLFAIWTLALYYVDVEKVGPYGSEVGFSTLNKIVHNITGVHMTLYNVTDWLGIIPLCCIISFGLMGLIQWIKRKKLKRVDYSILALGVFYIVVMIAYIFFEIVIVNYRPILINGILEPSYPSSTTVLVMCVMPTVIMQVNERIKNTVIRRSVEVLTITFMVFMVVGRLISGVHWFSDIFGGAMFSAGLVMIYYSVGFNKR